MAIMSIPYSRKVWRVESLVNFYKTDGKMFAICQKPSKLVVTINNPLADLFICQTFSAKCLKRVNLPNFLPTKSEIKFLCTVNNLYTCTVSNYK